MRIIAFRGETTLSALADKVFADLTPDSRPEAEAALLRANPQLARLDRLAPGAVLTVPRVPGLKPRPGRGLEEPAGELLADLARRLGDYGAQLSDGHEAHEADLKSQVDLLKDKQLKRILAAVPALRALADQAAETLRAEAKETVAARKQIAAAIKRLQADLAER